MAARSVPFGTLARGNIGSGFFISGSIAKIVRSTGVDFSHMVEMISPYNTRARAALGGRRLGVRQCVQASPQCLAGLGFLCLFVVNVWRRRSALAWA